MKVLLLLEVDSDGEMIFQRTVKAIHMDFEGCRSDIHAQPLLDRALITNQSRRRPPALPLKDGNGGRNGRKKVGY